MRVNLGHGCFLVAREGGGVAFIDHHGRTLGPRGMVYLRKQGGAFRVEPAACVVQGWAWKKRRLRAAMELARRFCWQWSRGPQVERMTDEEVLQRLED